MTASGRSRVMLGALGLVAFANGLLLCLTLTTVLDAALRLLEQPGLPLALGAITGAVAGIAVLVVSLRRERALRQGRYRAWRHHWSPHPLQAELAHSLARLATASALRATPSVRVLGHEQPNAFAVGRSRDEAVIVVTDSLLDLLAPNERDAVLAHELAHVESEDIKAVGLADAIAGSIGDAQSIKGRVLWGPRRVFDATWRLYLAMFLVGLFAMLALPLIEEDSLAYLLVTLVFGGALYAYGRKVTAGTLHGMVQSVLLLLALGPLTVVEAAVAAPTALMISRLVSRDREYAADRRSTELTAGCTALISALEKLQDAMTPGRAGLDEVRFALIVPAPLPRGLRGWIARLYATHPPIARRIDALRALEARKMAPGAAEDVPRSAHGCQNHG